MPTSLGVYIHAYIHTYTRTRTFIHASMSSMPRPVSVEVSSVLPPFSIPRTLTPTGETAAAVVKGVLSKGFQNVHRVERGLGLRVVQGFLKTFNLGLGA